MTGFYRITRTTTNTEKCKTSFTELYSCLGPTVKTPTQKLGAVHKCMVWLTHYFQIVFCGSQEDAYNTTAWEAYQRVNGIFADKISEEATEGDLVWVHGYHLLLVPRLLRGRLHTQNKDCPIGLSLHTPFPADDFRRGHSRVSLIRYHWLPYG
jgi:trehalose-6-phosphate synthase